MSYKISGAIFGAIIGSEIGYTISYFNSAVFYGYRGTFKDYILDRLHVILGATIGGMIDYKIADTIGFNIGLPKLL